MVTSLAEYLDEVDKLWLRHGDLSSTTMPWFRGQSRADWALLPSIYRGECDPSREREMNRDFMLRALTQVDVRPKTSLGWMFVMQHYGMLTRLLDWTESSLVALYFAVEDHLEKGNAAVWSLHPWELNAANSSFGQSSVPVASSRFKHKQTGVDIAVSSAYEFPPATEDDKGNPLAIRVDLPLAVRPAHTTRRIIAQKGQFTVHGKEKESLESVASRTAGFEIKSVVIDGGAKLPIMKELYRAGISRYSLFPELDGLAKEIRFRYSKRVMA